MAEDTIGRQMVASYDVAITGVKRTRKQLEKLDYTIQQLRKTNYSSATPSVIVAGSIGGKDILASKMDDLEGQVQAAAMKAMSSGMAMGRRIQVDTLNAAVTPTGSARFARGRGGSAGRNDSGDMIKNIKTNVETLRLPNETRIAGWHGWPIGARGRGMGRSRKGGSNKDYFFIQEKRLGANSLGTAIFTVREYLKRELAKVKR